MRPREVATVPDPFPCRILLVEDNDALRTRTTTILDEDGFDVVSAADAESALDHLTGATSFDLLFSSIGLPGMDGWSLAKRASRLHPTMPILLMTTYAGDVDARPHFLYPGMNLIRKPFTAEEVLGSVRELA